MSGQKRNKDGSLYCWLLRELLAASLILANKRFIPPNKDGRYAANTLEGDTAVQEAPEQREGEPSTSPQSIGNVGDTTSQTKIEQMILAE